MFNNWSFPNFLSWAHDVLVPAAMTVVGLALDPATSAQVTAALGPHGAVIVAILGALAHFGDSQVNKGLPPK